MDETLRFLATPDGLDPEQLPTEVLRDVLAWNDPNGDFDAFDDGRPLTRDDLLEIALDPTNELNDLWTDPRAVALAAAGSASARRSLARKPPRLPAARQGETMTNNKTRTITLTDRPPVTIREEEWPVVAVAAQHDGEVEYQANRRWGLRVRQHEDGRALVYATYSTAFRGEDDYRGGELLESHSDVPAAIRRVGERAAEHTADGEGDTRRYWPALIDECIADLPPEAL